MTIKTDNLQIGVSATPGNNFVLQADGAGGFKLSRGVVVGGVPVTSQDILTADSNGYVDFAPTPWVVSNPVATSSAGAFANCVTTMRTRKQGRTVFYQISVDVAAVGTASGNIKVPLPYPAAGIGVLREWSFSGRESRQVGYVVQAWITSGGPEIVMNPVAGQAINSNHLLNVSGFYESAA
jgi:hypothetical protein